MKKISFIIASSLVAVVCLSLGLLTSCSSKPSNATPVNALPRIFPDYAGTTIPVDIAPLDFSAVGQDAEAMYVVVKGSKSGEMEASGDYADFDVDDWHKLTEENKGGKLTFSVFVKRGGEITEVHTLDSIPSKNMEWEMPSEEEKLRQAKELNAYLVSAVEKTFCEAKRLTNERPGVEVVISIASYTVDGTLNDSRSGYAKLCALGSNYAELLASELSGRLRCDIDVRLIHDGTAVALNFRNRKNTVCLSVGSYFGIGFPETRVV